MWIAATVLLIVGAGAWFAAGRCHRFAYWIDRKTPAQIEGLAVGRWRVDRLAVPGAELFGLVRTPAAGTPPRWILFVPGNSQALLPGFQAELERCCPPDAGLAFWAYRGFEASTGVPGPAALRADLRLQWQRVRALAGDAPIELFGYSLGTPLAVQLAADLVQRGDAGPTRIVLAAAAERIPVMRQGPFGRFQPDDVYDCAAVATDLPCPIMIVHGSNDDALPLAGAEALAARFGARATLHIAPGRGHADLWPDIARMAFLRD